MQAEKVELLFFALAVLVERIAVHAGAKGADAVCTYSGQLFVEDLFEQLDVHFEARRALVQLRAELARHSAFYRDAQKRFLQAVRDDAAAGRATGIDALIEHSASGGGIGADGNATADELAPLHGLDALVEMAYVQVEVYILLYNVDCVQFCLNILVQFCTCDDYSAQLQSS